MAVHDILKASVGLWLFGHVLLRVTSLDSATCEAVVPGDTVSKLGEKAVLKCRLSSQNIAWTFCPRNGQPKLIVSNCVVAQSASQRYRVDKTNSACNLVIDNVTLSHLGHYTCQDWTLNDDGHTVELGNTNENLAANKKAIQSSTYTDGFFYVANLALDGNYDNVFGHRHCTATQPISPAWWAVDLGQETPVGRVKIQNRADSAVDINRLQNFYIGLTNVSPWTQSPPNMANSSLCKYYTGIPPPEYALDIFCEPNTLPGQYLFILFNRADYLTLCEVEVYYK